MNRIVRPRLTCACCDLPGQPGNPVEQEAREVAHCCQQHAVITIDDGRKATNMRRTGGGHDTLPGQMGAQRVDCLCALANQ